LFFRSGDAPQRNAKERGLAEFVVLGLFVTTTSPSEERAMNWDRVEGNWKQVKGQVQQQWGKLTNDDLDVIEGKRTELAGRLQERYGMAKDEADRQIDDWLKTSH
jgi:uncharacterized protein YjbJ (UPF0337 family)